MLNQVKDAVRQRFSDSCMFGAAVNPGVITEEESAVLEKLGTSISTGDDLPVTAPDDNDYHPGLYL